MPGPFAYPKSRRITSGTEYDTVRQLGRTTAGGLFLMNVLRHPPEESPQMTRTGIIVSRKVGNAVMRNRTKRRLRELVRHERPGLPSGLWITLLARRPILKASTAEIHEEWLRLGRKAGIFKPVA